MFIERYLYEGRTIELRFDEASLVVVEDGVERIEVLPHANAIYARVQALRPPFYKVFTTLENTDTDAREPAAPVYNARNDTLEAPLRADPYDRDAWRVYGDWLQEQGDPRGEYIALRAAVIERPGDAFAILRLFRHARTHDAYLRGAFPGRSDLGLGGFTDVLEATQHTAAALQSPDARVVTKMSISSGYAGGLDAAVTGRGPHLPVTVRELHLGGHELTRLEPLAATLDRVHELSLRVPICASAFDDLATRPLPNLRRLEIQGNEDERELPRALLASRLPALTRLHLELICLDADLVQTIADAPYAAHLEVLSLLFLDDAAARVLMDRIGRFPALTELHVEDYRLSHPVNHELWHQPWSERLLRLDRSSLVYYPE